MPNLDPITRKEQFLSRAAGGPGLDLDPITREEHFLQAIANSGGGGGGSGLTDAVKQTLLNCFNHVAWTDEHGQDYVDALEAALYPVDHITAVYTQSGTVYDTDSLDSLKADLVVTATYEGGSTSVVPATDYTLSGTLETGESVITATYRGKTATFTVEVTHDTNAPIYTLPQAFVSTGANTVSTGVALDSNTTMTIVATFSVASFTSTIADVFSNEMENVTGLTGLRTQRINSKRYLWGNGFSFEASENFANVNQTIRYVVVCVVDGQGNLSREWYIKNVSTGTQNNGTWNVTTGINAGQGFDLGCPSSPHAGAGTGTGFSGTISDFKIYDRALTSDEISAYIAG